VKNIGLIGLGNAGRPIGEKILQKGFPLWVYDLNPEPVEALAKLGARKAASAAAAVQEVTLTVLNNRSSS
jgi:3-hydroxyisobutyrate dehydrogenase-like beta-hydroxyacid dehydrogenase